MTEVTVRLIKGGGINGPLDSLEALDEEDITASGTSQASTVTGTGSADEIIVIYPETSDVRVATGTSPTATTSAGPRAYAGQANAFRNIKEGETIAVIIANVT